ncbi:MAG: S9 family peptidase [Bacillota bacterium]|jgi:dipeptidyl aminopeptidase/acylaminoacyl peptidase
MTTAKRPVTARDLWSLKFVGEPQLSPDGESLVWVETIVDAKRNRYESSLYLSKRNSENRFDRPKRLTYGKRSNGEGASDRSPRFSPDGSQLAFLSDRSGKTQIWLLDMLEAGEARQITDVEDGVSQITWSPDNRSIAYVSKEPRPETPTPPDGIRTDGDVTVITKLRYKANGVPGVVDPRPSHIYIVDVQTGDTKQVTSGDFDDSEPTFSPDGSTVAFVSCREPDRELRLVPDLWTVSVQGGEPRRLTFGKGPVHNPVYSPDGKWIAVMGHEGGETGIHNVEVMVIPSQGGPAKHLWGTFDRSAGCGIINDARFDAGSPGPYWTKDSEELYFIASDRSFSGIYRTCLARPQVELVGGAFPGNIGSCRHFPSVVVSLAMADLGSGEILFAFNGSTTLNPGDIYAVKSLHGTCMPADATCALQKVTGVNDGLLAGLTLVAPEPFTFESKDGLKLDGWMIKPASYQEGNKYPAVLEVHGGPHVAYGEVFFLEFQLLASRGYGVFYCNPRGSSNYGPDFAAKVIGDWGGMDYQDIMSLKDYMDRVPWVDKDRTYITGGSYGGFMTNWVVSHTDRFKAAVTQRSISNMYSKYGCSDIGWFGNKKGMGGRDLWDDEDFIMSKSPIRYAPFVKTPLLILHSEQDYRCPLEQAEQWYVALKRLGKEVEFVKFANENHELSRSGKPWNRIERLERIVEWFDRHP